jgi:hypothetical protein
MNREDYKDIAKIAFFSAMGVFAVVGVEDLIRFLVTA